jgi:hypothetical protein
VLRMPGLVQRAAVNLGETNQIIELAERGAGWFFHQHVTARAEHQPGRLVVRLRRSADCHGIQVGSSRKHLFETRVARSTFDYVMTAGDGEELESRVGSDTRNVLIARDLADPDQTYMNRRLHVAVSGPLAALLLITQTIHGELAMGNAGACAYT